MSSEDKFYSKNSEIFNEFSLLLDENEHNFLPILFENSTEDNDKNENLESEFNKNMNYSIPDEPFAFSKKDTNIKTSLTVPNIEIKYPEKYNNHTSNLALPNEEKKYKTKEDNNNIKNLTIAEESLVVHNSEITSDKLEEGIINSFLSNKKKIRNEKEDKNKFNPTNIIRKCKYNVLDSISQYTNNKIKQFYNNNIGNGLFKKQFLSLNGQQKSGSNIQFNKLLLNKPLKDIFSADISGKYTYFPKDYNKKLVENLLNEKDSIIKDYFTNLFNLTFIQCLEHYIGTQFYNELNGMNTFEDDSNNFKNDEEYGKTLKYYLDNFKSIINKKKSRNPIKKDDTQN